MMEHDQEGSSFLASVRSTTKKRGRPSTRCENCKKRNSKDVCTHRRPLQPIDENLPPRAAPPPAAAAPPSHPPSATTPLIPPPAPSPFPPPPPPQPLRRRLQTRAKTKMLRVKRRHQSNVNYLNICKRWNRKNGIAQVLAKMEEALSTAKAWYDLRLKELTLEHWDGNRGDGVKAFFKDKCNQR